MRKAAAFGVLLALVLFGGVSIAWSQEFVLPENLPALQAPIIVTTCGQSPAALMFALICNDLGIECTEMDTLTVTEFLAECDPSQPTQWAKVLVITTGTSLKGMGAAGVDVDSEVARCLGLIEEAKRLGIIVIVAQIEGIARRVDEYDEKSITSMSPLADFLITRADINGDGYFTTLAAENGIPQVFINETLDLERLLPLLFPAVAG
jgi:hypothetical protein